MLLLTSPNLTSVCYFTWGTPEIDRIGCCGKRKIIRFWEWNAFVVAIFLVLFGNEKGLKQVEASDSVSAFPVRFMGNLRDEKMKK